MTLPNPLQDLELLDCAGANGNQGIAVAAQQCGYGDDLPAFETAIRDAGKKIGVVLQGFDDFIRKLENNARAPGMVVAPDTASEL